MLNFLKKLCGKPSNQEWDRFYFAFEQEFRGDFSTILTRHQERYGTILPPVKKSSDSVLTKALDLGCGRGEFLQFLSNSGYQAEGIDLNSPAIALARERGLIARKADILSELSSRPSASLGLISSFHVIEHCEPEYTFSIFKECARLLAKGGHILFETPSALSLYSSARNFSLDPTHRNPIHPQYMQFMARYFGFTDIRIMGFSPHMGDDRAPVSELLKKNALADGLLEDWLYGPMDLAIWAMK